MIRSMKSLGIRLWILAMVAVPVCFYVLPRVKALGVESHGLIPAGMLMVGIFIFVHFALDLLGRRLIASLLEEARAWERAGLSSRAGRTYVKAAGIYDSFLLSPWPRAAIAQEITGALARFALTCEPENPAFFRATEVHIKQFPGDETLAQLFLNRIRRRGRTSRTDEGLLTRLSEVHHGHGRLGPLLADILMDLGRTDFAARKVFKSALDNPGLPRTQRERILELDQASGLTLGEAAGKAKHVERDGSGRGPGIVPLLNGALKGGGRLFGLIFNGVMITVLLMFQWGQRAGVYSGRMLYRLWRGERTVQYLKWGIIGLCVSGVIYFAGNTVSHLTDGGSGGDRGSSVVKNMPKPFTIQVAAYLKQKHADGFVAQLKDKGVVAGVKKVGGGGKTWYLVRVSEFSDKASATAYGNKLKARKIIEDFFVSNK